MKIIFNMILANNIQEGNHVKEISPPITIYDLLYYGIIV